MSQNQKGIAHLTLLPIILIILTILGFYYLNNSNFNDIPKPITKEDPAITLEEQENNPSESCYSQNYYLALAQREFIKETGFTQNKNKDLNVNRGIGELNWKRAADEPYISFPISTGLLLEHAQNPFNETIKQYQQKMEPLLFSRGYSTDNLNNTSWTIPELQKNTNETFGYRNGKTLLQVTLQQSETERGTVTQLFLTCAKDDEKLNQLYTDLIFSPSGKKVLADSYGEKGLNSMILSIWNIYEPNVIKTNIGSLDWIGGHSAWFAKEQNGEWSVIHQSQDHPECTTLEKYKAQKGIDCYRGEKSDQTR